MIHETTWEDIARGYRQVLTQVIFSLADTYNFEAMQKLVSSVQALDAEAELAGGKRI